MALRDDLSLHISLILRHTAQHEISQPINTITMVLNGWQHDLNLSDGNVTLQPLSLQQSPDLANAAEDGNLASLWYTSVPTSATVTNYIKSALAERAVNQSLPFAVYDHRRQCSVGSTRYCHVDHHNRRVEIGYTWYGKRAQRTSINTRCKTLLLTHAFETMQCIAVEFRTHWFNQNSRAAIERLGAKQDGVLRNHQLLDNGSYRDTVVYSIIRSEWPAVKAHLHHQLQRSD